MTLTLSKIADTGKRKPTGQEKDQFLKQAGDFQRRFMDGSLVPDLALMTWQQISEGWVISEGEIAVPERKPAEVFLSKPIRHTHLEFISEFPVEIPADASLDGTPRTVYYADGWNSNITDANFHTSLVRGKRYMAEVYQLRRNKSLESLVKIADEQKRILPGALGGAVLTSRYGEKLPKDFWVTCLDKPENLLCDARGLLVPCGGWVDVGWNFGLVAIRKGIKEDIWIKGIFVVFFRELVSDP